MKAVVTGLGYEWCLLLHSKREVISSSSSSMAASVLASALSPWLVVLSTSPASSHYTRADVFGKTARVIAALRRSRAICTSCSHLCWKAFADIGCPFRHCLLHCSRNTPDARSDLRLCCQVPTHAKNLRASRTRQCSVDTRLPTLCCLDSRPTICT